MLDTTTTTLGLGAATTTLLLYAATPAICAFFNSRASFISSIHSFARLTGSFVRASTKNLVQPVTTQAPGAAFGR